MVAGVSGWGSRCGAPFGPRRGARGSRRGPVTTRAAGGSCRGPCSLRVVAAGAERSMTAQNDVTAATLSSPGPMLDSSRWRCSCEPTQGHTATRNNNARLAKRTRTERQQRTLPRQAAEQPPEPLRAGGVQPARGLVEEQRAGPVDHLERDREAAPLAAGDPPGGLVADCGAGHLREVNLGCFKTRESAPQRRTLRWQKRTNAEIKK